MQTKIWNWFLSTLIVTSVAIVGCTPQQGTPTASAGSPSPSSPSPSVAASVSTSANQPRLDGKATVVMTVKGSPITIEVNGTDAPLTAGNFVDLVNQKFYDGLVFHRVVREPQPFVVQGGDPQSRNPNIPLDRLGTGEYTDASGQPRRIPLEIKPQNATEPVYSKTLSDAGVNAKPKLRHTRGAVAMARSSDPNSASSQFYIALADLPVLDGDYAVFGYVTQGMETVDKIQQGDRIESAKVTQGLENLKNAGTASPTSGTPSPTASPTTSP